MHVLFSSGYVYIAPTNPGHLTFVFGACLSRRQASRHLRSKIGLERANSTMQRLIVALCLSAAAALVPNSAAARSSNAKAPLKVGLPASVARISHPVLEEQALHDAAAALAAHFTFVQ